MYTLVFKAALAVYFISTIGYAASLIVKRVFVAKLSTWILAFAFAIHAVSLLMRYFETGHSPVLEVYDTLSFFAWVITGSYLILQFSTKTRVLGAFVSPVVFVIMVIASVGAGGHIPVSPVLEGSLVAVHVFLSVTGEALFVIASAAGAMYLLQDGFLKKRRTRGYSTMLPSLRDMDRINHVCLLWGFPILTLGVLAGSMWARTVWGSHWQWDPKQIWALLAWIFYAVLLHQRLAIGWKGRKAALYSVVAFVVLLVSLVILKGFFPSAHSFV